MQHNWVVDFRKLAGHSLTLSAGFELSKRTAHKIVRAKFLLQ